MGEVKTIYWLLEPQCDSAKKVKQVDGLIAYVCSYERLIGD